MEAWLDGLRVLAHADVTFRGDGKGFHIDGLYFSFFGGNDASWAPDADQSIDFDDFIIATAAPPTDG